MAGEENLGHFPSPKLGRAGVLRRFEQAGAETVIGRRLLVPENAGKQPNDGIDEDDGGNRTICEDVIADRNLGVDKVLDDAMVDPFVMSANYDEMFSGGEFSRERLI